jgi:mannose-6-phosphate isomerase-like protein (cupin superfamily)
MDAQQSGIVPVASGRAFDDLRAHWATLPARVKFARAADSPEVGTPFGPIYVLLRGEETSGQLGLYEQFVASGTGAGPHHQTTEDEAFYIIEGEWEFLAGDTIRRVGPGTLIYAPVDVAHAFKSLDPARQGRMLSWNAPAGHERFYVGVGDAGARGLDRYQVAETNYHVVFRERESGRSPAAPSISGRFVHRDEVGLSRVDGNEIATLLSERESGGRFTVREIVAEPGAAAMDAAPADDNRYFFVVAGEWEIAAGDERRGLGEGAVVFVPGGVMHSARLTGTGPGKLLEIAAPLAPRD